MKGYSERKILSKNAVWSGTIYAKSTNLQDAHRNLQKGITAVNEILKSTGAEKILVGSIDKIEFFKRNVTSDGREIITNEIDFYKLSIRISFSSDEIKLVQAVSQKTSNVWEIAENFELESNGINYYYPSIDLEKLKLELIKEATENGRMRAEQFAISSGAKVSNLVKAKQGIFQVVGENSTATWDTYDTSSYEKIVKCVCDLSFLIK